MPEDKKMPSAPKPMAPQGSAKKDGPMNIWMIVSAVLAIAVVALIVMWPKAGASNTISADDAGAELITFVNKIYGPQIGLSTLKSVEEKSGIYQVTVTVDNNGQAVDQIIFITQDGLYFIPQALDIAEVENQFDEFVQQQQAAGIPLDNDIEPIDGAMLEGSEQPENPEDAAAL